MPADHDRSPLYQSCVNGGNTGFVPKNELGAPPTEPDSIGWLEFGGKEIFALYSQRDEADLPS
jgi:hypothetical protein